MFYWLLFKSLICMNLFSQPRVLGFMLHYIIITINVVGSLPMCLASLFNGKRPYPPINLFVLIPGDTSSDRHFVSSCLTRTRPSQPRIIYFWICNYTRNMNTHWVGTKWALSLSRPIVTLKPHHVIPSLSTMLVTGFETDHFRFKVCDPVLARI